MNRFKINNGWIELIVENDYHKKTYINSDYSTAIKLSSITKIKTYTAVPDGMNTVKIIELFIDSSSSSVHYYPEGEYNIFYEDIKYLRKELGMIDNE